MSYLKLLRTERSLLTQTENGNKRAAKEACQTEYSFAVPKSAVETNANVGVRKDAKKAKEAEKVYQTEDDAVFPLRKKEEEGCVVSSQDFPDFPWELKRLLAAAASDVLQADLPGVPDAGRYTLAWGVSYLTGDREEALRRLWQVYRAWKRPN